MCRKEGCNETVGIRIFVVVQYDNNSSKSLLGLEAVTTLETLTEQNVPDAVEQLTKGLPVKVKVKKALRQIYVQRKQDKEMMSIHGKVLDNITRNDLPGAVVTLMTRDSTIIGTREAKSFWMNMAALPASLPWKISLRSWSVRSMTNMIP